MARIDGLKGLADGRWPHCRHIYGVLGERGLMAAASRLQDASAQIGVHGVRVVLISKEEALRRTAATRRNSFVQRVFAECDCGREVPFGRLGQHRKACSASVYHDTHLGHKGGD